MKGAYPKYTQGMKGIYAPAKNEKTCIIHNLNQ